MYVHSASGMRFPSEIGIFTRVEVHHYNESESNTSIAYHSTHPETAILATVYVYPSNSKQSNLSEVLASEFDRVMREILDTDPNARVTQVADREPASVCPTKVARFQTQRELVRGRGPDPVLSELILIVAGDWFVKYRFSYPVWQAENADSEIQRFVASLELPEGSLVD